MANIDFNQSIIHSFLYPLWPENYYMCILRKEAWNDAVDALSDLKKDEMLNQDTSRLRKRIAKCAVGKGFLDVWMTVFRNDSDMLSLLSDEFRKGDQGCFDTCCPCHK